MNDSHEVLGLPSDADEQQVRSRYLELVRAYPPERHPQRFAEIQAAYAKLRDPAARLEALLFDDGPVNGLDELILEEAADLAGRRLPTHVLLSLGDTER